MTRTSSAERCSYLRVPGKVAFERWVSDSGTGTSACESGSDSGRTEPSPFSSGRCAKAERNSSEMRENSENTSEVTEWDWGGGADRGGGAAGGNGSSIGSSFGSILGTGTILGAAGSGQRFKSWN